MSLIKNTAGNNAAYCLVTLVAVAVASRVASRDAVVLVLARRRRLPLPLLAVARIAEDDGPDEVGDDALDAAESGVHPARSFSRGTRKLPNLMS